MEQYRKTFTEDGTQNKEYGRWFTVIDDGPPPYGVVVIAQFSGWWGGSGGIRDLYWWGDDWFNYPERYRRGVNV